MLADAIIYLVYISVFFLILALITAGIEWYIKRKTKSMVDDLNPRDYGC